jgi:hypothetical protein
MKTFRGFLLSYVLGMILISCDKGEDPFPKSGETFKGSFTRYESKKDPVSANVQLRFKNGKFEGGSDQVNFPAICEGTYRLKGEMLNFRNSCMFPANFDWSLILVGDFDYERKSDSLIISRSYDWGGRDEYRLKVED